MRTDLFVLAHGLDPRIAEAAVPPGCRMPMSSGATKVLQTDEAIIASDELRPRTPARHFVPAFSPLACPSCAYRFELSFATRGEWSPWIASAAIGGGGFPTGVTGTESIQCDVDVFTSSAPVDAVELRVRVRADDLRAVLDGSWLVTLSACDLAPVERSRALVRPVRMAVPVRSQMVEAEAIRSRICSPASVAMVLERWGRRVETPDLAAEIFHAATDRYGVWPAAIGAAARHGVSGYLLRFPDWPSAAWCLEAGLPIVASVRYARGELEGAAMAETDGHLLVVTGCDGGDVLLNDPAAPTHAEVPRRVRRDDLERAWLDRTGIGYVFFDVTGSR